MLTEIMICMQKTNLKIVGKKLKFQFNWSYYWKNCVTIYFQDLIFEKYYNIYEYTILQFRSKFHTKNGEKWFVDYVYTHLGYCRAGFAISDLANV